jgi:amino acid adenylation domain-containing protein
MLDNLFPASFSQQRLWFLDQLDPGNAAYNLPRVFRILGRLKVDALASAVEALVSRHDVLHTLFVSIDGEPRQSVLPGMPTDLRLIDLSRLPDRERQDAAFRVAGEEAKKPFDLTSGPLLRTTLIQLADEEHILVLVMHHIITDGWSMNVFFKELAALYAGFVDGHAPDLPKLNVSYRDFTKWQTEYVNGESLKEQIQYWTKKLHGAEPTLDLQSDHARPEIQTENGDIEHCFLSVGTAERLKRLSQSEGATLFMALLAAFYVLLWRYTSQESILIGTPVAGRTEVEVESVIGLFVNTLVLRADFSSDKTLRELLRQVRTTALEAYANQDVPFEKLVEELKPQRTLSHTPLFQVMLVLQNAPRQKLEIQDLVLEELEFDSKTAKFDLTLEIIEQEGLHLTFEYNSDLFDRATIKRMIGHFETLIEGFIENPDANISGVQLLAKEERNQVLVDWNDTSADYPSDLTIHAAFERQAVKTPEAVAFLQEGKLLTYLELNERANRLAHYLIQRNVRPGGLVGVSVEPSLEMAVAILGILKAGATYVPLDPSEPEQRLALMLEDSKVGAIVTQHALKNKLPENKGRLIFLDGEMNAIDVQSAMNPSLPVSPEDLAYVIYTSGSTGVPKGVEGTHRASMNRFAWMWNAYPFRAGETCCQKTALSFIDSVWELFGPLLQGVRSVIIPKQLMLDTRQFVDLLAKYEVSRIVLVPSLLQVLLDHSSDLAARIPRLTLWSVSGESLPSDLAHRFLAMFPRATLLNIYGSSEVAADVTWHEVRTGTEEPVATSSAPIGRPISNTQVYILDGNLGPVPAGVRGEIYVGGACLARGYRNMPDATRERFIANPFEPERSARLYKTGDLGRFLPDGTIEYLGRTDNQIKIRGMRVELGEVESVLRSHPLVREAAVVVHNQNAALLAYVVGSDGSAPATSQLRRFAQSKLPEHMVPSQYAVLKSLPVLPSGKIDRKTLQGLDLAQSELAQPYVAPRTQIEEALARIWSEVLRLKRVGTEDNFFELGGHSLLAVQVVSRIRRILDVELSVRTIFEEPVITRLAESVAKAKEAGLNAQRPIIARQTSLDSKEMLIAQLDKLSPDEIRALLRRYQ